MTGALIEGEYATDVAAVQAMAELYPSECPSPAEVERRLSARRMPAHMAYAWRAYRDETEEG